MSAANEAVVRPKASRVPGLPWLGPLFGMIKGPADFVRCYRAYGPVCRLSVLGKHYVLISGVEAANFMGTREGKDNLRSKEFWQGLIDEYGATRTLSGEDGESHKQLRAIMRKGYSKRIDQGPLRRTGLRDHRAARSTATGASARTVHVVEAMKYMVVDQLGTMITGDAPLEYVKDIRTAIIYILNVLVTRQLQEFLLKPPKYWKAKGSRHGAGAQDDPTSARARCTTTPAGGSPPGRRHHGCAH